MNKANWISCSLALIALVMLTGCASTGGGYSAPPPPSDEEVVTGLVASAMEALKAKDIATMVADYADDFSSDNGGKDDTIAFLQGASDQGFLDGIMVDDSSMTVAIDGDSATAGPIALEGAFGALTLSFDLEKRDGKWWVTSQSQEQ